MPNQCIPDRIRLQFIFVFFFSPDDNPSTKVFTAEHTVITASAWFENSQTLTARSCLP